MPIAVSLVLAALATSAPALLPVQPASQTGAPRACTLLTKELALSVTSAANRAVFDIMPPEEETVGTSGSACDYGDIRIQIDALSTASLERAVTQTPGQWTPVAGVGDRAWFRDNQQFAELAVIVGPRTLTIQMGVPFQGTADTVRPKAITLANALVPKLK